MLTVLVRNRSGVLQRITGLFSRRGYNIQSIYAEQTKNPAISRIIIEVAGDDFTISQVEKQLAKLVDVISVSKIADAMAEIQPEQPVIAYKNNHAVSDVAILDSTLRDGAQGEGIAFTVADKLGIVRSLDKLGIPYIEAGNPGSNQKDLEFFEQARALSLKHSQLVAFGSTRRVGVPVEEDQNVLALLKADTRVVSIFGKSWDLHVADILHTTQEENLSMIADTVRFFKEKGKTVIFDAEHFFDGYKANPGYALATLRAAEEAGASCITLCDTNGGCFPDEIYRITAEAAGQVGVQLGIHCHNDMGCAAANSMMAVEAGASHVQGTFTGFGERCGNANLSTLIASLQLKKKLHCIPQENLKLLTSTALYISDIANVTLSSAMPYVGKSAFAHKGGMHVDGVGKNTASFEHIDPSAVGNKRNVLLSEMSGKAALLAKISQVLPGITKDSPEAQELVNLLKQLEYEGYQFEAALASLELAMLKKLKRFQPFFELLNFKIVGEKAGEALDNPSAAVVKLRVGEKTAITADEGEGPVHALDIALRKAVQEFYPNVGKVRLVDYKVRVIEPKDATAAKVRVLIESTDGDTVWTTVGVSRDIINASLLALVDAVEYKLLKDSLAAKRPDSAAE